MISQYSGTRLVHFTARQRHGAESFELRRVTHRIGLEQVAMLCVRELPAMFVPLVFELRDTGSGALQREVGDRVVALDGERGFAQRRG